MQMRKGCQAAQKSSAVAVFRAGPEECEKKKLTE